MQTFLALSVIFLRLYGTAAVTHSLQYFYTASSEVPNFPEFVTVGMVDGQPISYYDSRTKKAIPKQDWMAENEGLQYWESVTQIFFGTEQTYIADVERVNKRFNRTGGVHTGLAMYGCEWDDETDEVKGFEREGFDGEDFVVFDMKTQTWIAPIPQAVITKHKWDNDKANTAQWMNYLTQECPEWLKKYVNYGRSSLMRKELPSVSLLQRSSSSPISCHATGFYPDRAEMVWKKDGVELHEGVHKGEILPNNDGTFQMSVDLKLSSVKAEDWDRYSCVFQLSGVNKDIITKLDKAGIRSNEGNPLSMIIPIIVAVVVLVVIAVIGFIVYKKRTDKRPPSPVENREVQEQMIPKP